MASTPHTTFRFDEETRAKLTYISEWYGMTMTEAITEMIKETHSDIVYKKHYPEFIYEPPDEWGDSPLVDKIGLSNMVDDLRAIDDDWKSTTHATDAREWELIKTLDNLAVYQFSDVFIVVEQINAHDYRIEGGQYESIEDAVHYHS